MAPLTLDGLKQVLKESLDEFKAELITGIVSQMKKADKAAKKKQNKDPNAPKGPKTAYIFFSIDEKVRAAAKKENPDANMKQMASILGTKWRELSEKEKKPYVTMAAKDKERCQALKAKYEAECTTASA